jgi:ectoine hydroxylase-related dioxygenase (phytanoyl-CoA dioxygenase family)
VLSGSHLRPERPSDDTFFSSADRLIVAAGTVVLFDSNLWHSAGKNIVRKPRRALTLNFSRPFIKQQLDYPDYLGTSHTYSLSEPMRQTLGYNSLTPKSLDE